MTKNKKEMFNAYVEYFPTINKRLKLDRGGKIRVICDNCEVEIFDSWESLNNKYQLFPTSTQSAIIEETASIPFKVWTYGDPNRYKEIKVAMEEKYLKICGKTIKFDSLDFKKKDWVYFMDSEGNFCQSGNDMVINLLQNSNDWVEFKLPIKKYTKAEIAELIGLSVNQFEIV